MVAVRETAEAVVGVVDAVDYADEAVLETWNPVWGPDPCLILMAHDALGGFHSWIAESCVDREALGPVAAGAGGIGSDVR